MVITADTLSRSMVTSIALANAGWSIAMIEVLRGKSTGKNPICTTAPADEFEVRCSSMEILTIMRC